MCCADGSEPESEQLHLIVLIAVSVCEMRASAVGVCTSWVQQNQIPTFATFRCREAKSNSGPDFGFEVANEGSIAYASIA
jgi:hypothetical protein